MIKEKIFFIVINDVEHNKYVSAMGVLNILCENVKAESERKNWKTIYWTDYFTASRPELKKQLTQTTLE